MYGIFTNMTGWFWARANVGVHIPAPWFAYGRTKKNMDMIEKLYIYIYSWLVVWNMNLMTFHILGITIPTDELIQNVLFCWKIYCIQILNWCLIGKSMLIGSSPDSDKMSIEQHVLSSGPQTLIPSLSQFWGFWAPWHRAKKFGGFFGD